MRKRSQLNNYSNLLPAGIVLFIMGSMSQHHKKLTTAAGAPVARNQQSLTAGERGSMLMEDVWLFEKLSHLNREVIPERRMHAKGYGAHGVFRTTADITRYTKADLFAEIGRETPVFVRFFPR